MRRHVTRWMTWTVALALAVAAPAVRAEDKAEDKEAKRLEGSRQSFVELTQVKEGIPRDLLDKARCIAVFPEVIKGALGWGGRHGKGVMSCRMADGSWGPPIFLTISGGALGFRSESRRRSWSSSS